MQLRMQFQYIIKHWIICIWQIWSYKAWLEARFAEIQLFQTNYKQLFFLPYYQKRL